MLWKYMDSHAARDSPDNSEKTQSEEEGMVREIQEELKTEGVDMIKIYYTDV